MLIITFCIGLAIFLLPDVALAWGPAMHLSFGAEILTLLSPLLPTIAKILERHKNDFLYGCLAPDITLGKRFVEYTHHCHNWDVGLSVLREAGENPSKQAFAYGYLCHLATDTIAHNYFVPFQLIASYPTRMLQHTYWEMRVDTFADREMWTLAYKLAEKYDESAHDKLLDKTLKKTFFSFKTNRLIFGHLLLLQNLKNWRRVTKLLHKTSRFELKKEDLEEYKKLSIAAIYDFLNKSVASQTYFNDPSGLNAIDLARTIRRQLKLGEKKRTLSKVEIASIIRSEKERLRENLIKKI